MVMAKTKRRNDKIYRLSKKRKSVSKEGGYNASPKDVVLTSPTYKDEDEWEDDNYTPGRIIRFVATVTGSVLISAGAIIYSSRHFVQNI
tara:strand:- start:19029 stop:19295 length:267 start_codon:yes stop_codon:yes gene_type:complete